jgi:VWFA-related protein
MRVHALLAAALLLAAPFQQPPQPQPPPPSPPTGQSQQQPPPANQDQPRPVIRSGINFVSVDVIVTDKKTGNVVLDMKQDDFEVREDRKPQKVETFDIVNIEELSANMPAPPREITSLIDEETEARKANVRLFILLLDDYHVRRGNDLFVRKPLEDFINNQLAPQDMVAVMYPLTPVAALTFTRNRSSLIQSVNQFLGRKGDYTPRNEFEEKYAYYPAVTVERIRDDISLGALTGAAIRLGGMKEGRKSIIYVSEGFTATLPPQVADPVAAMPGMNNPARGRPGQDVTDPRAESQAFFNTADLQSRLRDVYDTCNRNNTSIYAVDPRGLTTFEYDVNQGVSLTTDRTNLNSTMDTLRVLADNTDGRAIVNRNDLATGMKQIMRDASGYYLLGYTSTAAPTDGKFHTIDVKTKRPGVEVRARKGYWAYTTEDVARATSTAKAGPPPAVASALNTLVDPAREHAARFWTGTDRADNGQTRVMFVWEALAPRGAARSMSNVAARVQLTAMAADGRPVFRGGVPEGTLPDAPASPAASDTAPVVLPSASVTFAAPPGPIELKIVVQNDSGQVIDSTTQSLTLPDYAQTQVSFGTPRVYRARTAREALLIRNNADAMPIVAREFSRGERLLVRFDTYGAGGARPEVTAKLLNRAGQAMSDVPIAAADGKPFLIDFPLAALAAGEYVLELDAKSASGTAQQMIGFKIGS